MGLNLASNSKDDLELLTNLSPPAECWNYRRVLPSLVFVVLEIVHARPRLH